MGTCDGGFKIVALYVSVREQVRCKEEWEAKLLKVNSALTEATAQAVSWE